ncbi:hypothetical protein D3C71_793750 [compost metagenome]
MTTITTVAQPSAAPSFGAPAFFGAVMSMAALAMLLVASALVFLACFTMRSEMDMFLAGDLEHRIIQAGHLSKSCGSDGVEREDGVPNCFDHRGFRVIVGDGLVVYSMRHQKPLFVFGLQKGLMFVNERISAQQLEGEKSSFLGYMANAGR